MFRRVVLNSLVERLIYCHLQLTEKHMKIERGDVLYVNGTERYERGWFYNYVIIIRVVLFQQSC